MTHRLAAPDGGASIDDSSGTVRTMRRAAPTSPEAMSAAVREVCLSLPEVIEHADGWARNFEIRKRSFCLVVGRDAPTEGALVLVIRATDDDRETFLALGHPFFEIPKNKWKIGFSLSETTDWEDVRELITESYCLVAPKKLVALVDRPREA
jgi:hypothetical protein